MAQSGTKTLPKTPHLKTVDKDAPVLLRKGCGEVKGSPGCCKPTK